jgi:hypothetical protein
VQLEPAPVVAQTEPELAAIDEPIAAEERVPAAEEEQQTPAPVADAVAAEPQPGSEPVEPEPEPDLKPAAAAMAAEAAPQAQDVNATLVAWPNAAPAGGNGTPAQAGSFEEATSVIPAWQQADPNADPKRGTVSLQAMPPEQVASGASYAALLTFETGPFAGRIVALPDQMVTIGRAPDNDVVVGDPATSGHHGRIETRNGSFWISDLGSTNGTLVNGEPVIEKQLTHGDMIAIGQNTLRFTLED